jgi:hypothetical protein
MSTNDYLFSIRPYRRSCINSSLSPLFLLPSNTHSIILTLQKENSIVAMFGALHFSNKLDSSSIYGSASRHVSFI